MEAINLWLLVWTASDHACSCSAMIVWWTTAAHDQTAPCQTLRSIVSLADIWNFNPKSELQPRQNSRQRSRVCFPPCFANCHICFLVTSNHTFHEKLFACVLHEHPDHVTDTRKFAVMSIKLLQFSFVSANVSSSLQQTIGQTIGLTVQRKKRTWCL